MKNSKELVKHTGSSKFDVQCVYPINWVNVLADIKEFLLDSKECEDSGWTSQHACQKEIHVFGHGGDDEGENAAFIQIQDTGAAVCTDATTIDLSGFNMFELSDFIPEDLDIEGFDFTARRNKHGQPSTVISSDDFTVTKGGGLNLKLNCEKAGKTQAFCQDIEQCDRNDVHFHVQGTKDGTVALTTNVRIDKAMVVHLTHEYNGASTSASVKGKLTSQLRRRLLVAKGGGFGC